VAVEIISLNCTCWTSHQDYSGY